MKLWVVGQASNYHPKTYRLHQFFCPCSNFCATRLFSFTPSQGVPAKLAKEHMGCAFYLVPVESQASLVFMLVLYSDRSGTCSVVFLEGGKTGVPREKPSEQGENQQQTTYGTGQESNLVHNGGRRALSPLHQLCPPLCFLVTIFFKVIGSILYQNLNCIQLAQELNSKTITMLSS